MQKLTQLSSKCWGSWESACCSSPWDTGEGVEATPGTQTLLCWCASCGSSVEGQPRPRFSGTPVRGRMRILSKIQLTQPATRWQSSSTVPFMRVFNFKRKIRTWTGIRNSDLQISSLVLYHLSHPGLIDGTGLNISLEKKCYARCCGLWHYLSPFDRLTNFV